MLSDEAMNLVAVTEEAFVERADHRETDPFEDLGAGLAPTVLVGRDVGLRHAGGAGEVGLAHARRFSSRADVHAIRVVEGLSGAICPRLRQRQAPRERTAVPRD